MILPNTADVEVVVKTDFHTQNVGLGRTWGSGAPQQPAGFTGWWSVWCFLSVCEARDNNPKHNIRVSIEANPYFKLKVMYGMSSCFMQRLQPLLWSQSAHRDRKCLPLLWHAPSSLPFLASKSIKLASERSSSNLAVYLLWIDWYV